MPEKPRFDFYNSIRFKPDAFLRAPEPEPTHRFSIMTGTSNEQLADDIAAILGTTALRSVNPIDPETGRPKRFADGEPNIQIPDNVRDQNVYIIHPTSPSFDDHSVNDHYMELVGMADAAHKSSAKDITAVIPYYGYSRSDRKDKPRVPIMASLSAKMLEAAGINRMMIVDIHSEQFTGFPSIPTDILYARPVFEKMLRERGLTNVIAVTPDEGGLKRARNYYQRLPADGLAVMFKDHRVDKTNESEVIDMIGDVDGKIAMIFDDMIDSARTHVNAANHLVHEGGALEAYLVATHGIFSPGALERIDDSPITKVFVTDTIRPRQDVLAHPKIEIISIAPLLAEAIKRRQKGESISELLQ